MPEKLSHQPALPASRTIKKQPTAIPEQVVLLVNYLYEQLKKPEPDLAELLRIVETVQEFLNDMPHQPKFLENPKLLDDLPPEVAKRKISRRLYNLLQELEGNRESDHQQIQQDPKIEAFADRHRELLLEQEKLQKRQKKGDKLKARLHELEQAIQQNQQEWEAYQTAKREREKDLHFQWLNLKLQLAFEKDPAIQKKKKDASKPKPYPLRFQTELLVQEAFRTIDLLAAAMPSLLAPVQTLVRAKMKELLDVKSVPSFLEKAHQILSECAGSKEDHFENQASVKHQIQALFDILPKPQQIEGSNITRKQVREVRTLLKKQVEQGEEERNAEEEKILRLAEELRNPQTPPRTLRKKSPEKKYLERQDRTRSEKVRKWKKHMRHQRKKGR